MFKQLKKENKNDIPKIYIVNWYSYSRCCGYSYQHKEHKVFKTMEEAKEFKKKLIEAKEILRNTMSLWVYIEVK